MEVSTVEKESKSVKNWSRFVDKSNQCADTVDFLRFLKDQIQFCVFGMTVKLLFFADNSSINDT